MKGKVNCPVNAVITVEAAVVMGIILIGLALLLRMSLYLHDKAVISAAVMESAQAARERDRAEIEEAASGYFYARIEGKLLYFPTPGCSVSGSADRVTISAHASNGPLSLRASASAPLTDPEEKIREKHKEEKNG